MNISESTISGCIRNCPKAQRELYEALLPYLRAVAQRYLKDPSFNMDVLQESFVKIFNNIKNHDSSKAPLKNWAAKIVINCSLNYNKRVAISNVEEFNGSIHGSSFELDEIDDLPDEFLVDSLKEMPGKLYNVFNLNIIDGYTHKEIAQILNINESNSRKLLSRAKEWLRAAYQKNESDYTKIRISKF